MHENEKISLIGSVYYHKNSQKKGNRCWKKKYENQLDKFCEEREKKNQFQMI